MSLPAVGSRATAGPAPSSSADDGTDPATADVFAALVASFLAPASPTPVTPSTEGQLSSDAPAGTVATGSVVDGTGSAVGMPGALGASAAGTATTATAATPATIDLAALAAGATATTAAATNATGNEAGTGTATAAITADDATAKKLAGNAHASAAPSGAHSAVDDVKVDDGKVDGGATPAATITGSTAMTPQDAAVDDADGEQTSVAGVTDAASASASADKTSKRTVIATEPLDDSDADNVIHHAEPAQHPTPVHAAEAPSATEGTAPAQPHEQLAVVIAPLRHRADGSYHLALRLHPEHLGAVDLDVELHNGTVEVHVHAAQEDAKHLLLEHLDDLRAELERAGLRAGTLDVGDRGQARDRQAQRNDGTSRATGADSANGAVDTGPVTAAATSSTAVADGAVDVQL